MRRMSQCEAYRVEVFLAGDADNCLGLRYDFTPPQLQ